MHGCCMKQPNAIHQIWHRAKRIFRFANAANTPLSLGPSGSKITAETMNDNDSTLVIEGASDRSVLDPDLGDDSEHVLGIDEADRSTSTLEGEGSLKAQNNVADGSSVITGAGDSGISLADGSSVIAGAEDSGIRLEGGSSQRYPSVTYESDIMTEGNSRISLSKESRVNISQDPPASGANESSISGFTDPPAAASFPASAGQIAEVPEVGKIATEPTEIIKAATKRSRSGGGGWGGGGGSWTSEISQSAKVQHVAKVEHAAEGMVAKFANVHWAGKTLLVGGAAAVLGYLATLRHDKNSKSESTGVQL